MVVDRERCNGCHFDLAEHGGGRKSPEYCVMCHNPTNTNDERVARVEGTTVEAISVDFKHMIHRIHTGEELSEPFVLGGFPAPTVDDPEGSPVDFGEVRFPGDRRDCQSCHVDDNPVLPLESTVWTRFETLTCVEDPGADGDAYCNDRSSSEWFLSPTTAACVGCHDSPAAARPRGAVGHRSRGRGLCNLSWPGCRIRHRSGARPGSGKRGARSSKA